MIDLHSLTRAELERFVQRSKASSALIDEPDIAALPAQILRKAAEMVPSESGAILLDPLSKMSDPRRNRLHFVSAFGPAAAQLMGVSTSSAEGVAGRVYTTGEPYLSSDTQRDATFAPAMDATTGYRTRTIIAAPIRIGGAVCGAIELLNRADGEPFDSHDLLLLEVFASYMASSIQNALDARNARALAQIDDLIGLSTDRYLYFCLRKELARIKGEDRHCALLFMDLDHFKPINDTFGHLVASQVLREVGFVLRRVTRDYEVVLARYGGDEFGGAAGAVGRGSGSAGRGDPPCGGGGRVPGAGARAGPAGAPDPGSGDRVGRRGGRVRPGDRGGGRGAIADPTRGRRHVQGAGGGKKLRGDLRTGRSRNSPLGNSAESDLGSGA